MIEEDLKEEQFFIGNFALKNLSLSYHQGDPPFDLTLHISDGIQVRDVEKYISIKILRKDINIIVTFNLNIEISCVVI